MDNSRSKRLFKRSRTRLRRAVIGTRDAVTSALAASTARNCRFAPGIQSPNRSIIFALTSASSTTTRSASRSNGAIPLRIDTPKLESSKVPGSSSHASSTTIRDSSSSNNLVEEKSSLSEEQCRYDPADTNGMSIFEADWLTLYLPFNGDADSYYRTAEDERESKSASQSVYKVRRFVEPSACTFAQVINIADLAVGGTLILKETMSNELDVMFTYPGFKDIVVRLLRERATKAGL